MRNPNQQSDGTSKVIAAIASATDKPFQVAYKATLGVAMAQLTALAAVVAAGALLLGLAVVAYKLLG
jgi:hypothetical protein